MIFFKNITKTDILIIIAVILVITVFIRLSSIKPKPPCDNHEELLKIALLEQEIVALHNENIKLELYADSIMNIPYKNKKTKIIEHYEERIKLIADLNADSLDLIIRSNW